MIEVILTCLLYAGTTYTAPVGWDIVDLTLREAGDLTGMMPGQSSLICSQGTYWGACPVERGKIRLRHTFQPGEKLKFPSGCEMEAKKP